MTDERRARAARESFHTPPTETPEEDGDATLTHLRVVLAFAVPMWIAKLRSKSFAEIQYRADVCGDVVAGQGDIIMFQRGQKRGRTATAFNRFAEGVACAAFQVGGCTVFGLHFEEPAPPGELQGRGSEGDVVRDALDRLRAYELAQYPVKS